MNKVILVCALLFGNVADAQDGGPLPETQWTRAAHLWLARAMIAEAGWEAERDHVAIAYVLARRWRRIRQRFDAMRFVDVVRNYCAGLGDYKRSLTPRQRWVRTLGFMAIRPSGWPEGSSWQHHQRFWRAALSRSDAWFRGMIEDPCRGRALHWGGTIDSPHGRMTRVECGPTRNTFYGLR